MDQEIPVIDPVMEEDILRLVSAVIEQRLAIASGDDIAYYQHMLRTSDKMYERFLKTALRDL